jgi:hypothetical protein
MTIALCSTCPLVPAINLAGIQLLAVVRGAASLDDQDLAHQLATTLQKAGSLTSNPSERSQDLYELAGLALVTARRLETP